jgi:hypothetical protein
LLLTCFPKEGLCDLHGVCHSHPVNFLMSEPIFTKPGIIWPAYFINPSHQSCVYICISLSHATSQYKFPLSLLGNGSLKKTNRGNEYTSNNRNINGRVVLMKERRLLVIPRTSCFLKGLWWYAQVSRKPESEKYWILAEKSTLYGQQGKNLLALLFGPNVPA